MILSLTVRKQQQQQQQTWKLCAVVTGIGLLCGRGPGSSGVSQPCKSHLFPFSFRFLTDILKTSPPSLSVCIQQLLACVPLINTHSVAGSHIKLTEPFILSWTCAEDVCHVTWPSCRCCGKITYRIRASLKPNSVFIYLFYFYMFYFDILNF